MLTIAILLYVIAMVAANWIVATVGPWTIPFNAFFLIGLDLALRDLLHTRLRSWQMTMLIVFSGMVTFMLNEAAGQIALASAVAFIAAGVADWLAFSVARGSWLKRSMLSNPVGAAVDSLVFPLVAFGGVDPKIASSMFIAKLAGAVVWAWGINRFVKA